LSKQKQSGLSLLKRDKKLEPLIKKIGPLSYAPEGDIFIALLRAIVSQQLSDKAAATIWKRFLALFADGIPEAKELLRFSDDKLRAVGLSYQKAGYLKNIANFSLEHKLHAKSLKAMDDEDLILFLTQIKGVGRWTTEMILMFSLARPDVFPLDDVGIQNGMKALYGLRGEKKKLQARMLKVAEQWRPHRSLACFYIWRYKDAGFAF
jgi:DNA-3-methyladenine glycosylase II